MQPATPRATPTAVGPRGTRRCSDPPATCTCTARTGSTGAPTRSASPTGWGRVLRALEPTVGLELMRERRGVEDDRLLCAGPGRLTQALGITGDHDGLPLDLPPFRVLPVASSVTVETTPRVGITRAGDRLWRYVLAGSSFPSRPRPRAGR